MSAASTQAKPTPEERTSWLDRPVFAPKRYSENPRCAMTPSGGVALGLMLPLWALGCYAGLTAYAALVVQTVAILLSVVWVVDGWRLHRYRPTVTLHASATIVRAPATVRWRVDGKQDSPRPRWMRLAWAMPQAPVHVACWQPTARHTWSGEWPVALTRGVWPWPPLRWSMLSTLGLWAWQGETVPSTEVVVWPQAWEGPAAPPQQAWVTENAQPTQESMGPEGWVRPWRPGESMRHLAHKASAKRDAWLVGVTVTPPPSPQPVLRWSHALAMAPDVEHAVSLFSAWVEHAHGTRQPWHVEGPEHSGTLTADPLSHAHHQRQLAQWQGAS